MDSKHSFASRFLDKLRKSAEGRPAYPDEWRISISDEAAERIRSEGQPLYARDTLYTRGQIEFFKDNRKIITKDHTATPAPRRRRTTGCARCPPHCDRYELVYTFQ